MEPWHYNQSLLALSPLAGDGILAKRSFNSFAFQMHILSVPMKYMSKEMAEFIDVMLGDVEWVDAGPYGDFIG